MPQCRNFLNLSLIIFLLLCIGNSVVGEETAGVSPVEVPDEEISTYSDSSAGFSLNHPFDYSTAITEFPDSKTGEMHHLVTFESLNNVTPLIIDAVTANISAEQVTAEKKALNEAKNGYKLISENNMKLGGKDATSWDYEYIDAEGGNFTVKEVVAFNEGRAYYIDSVKIKEGADISKVADDMLSSFSYIPIKDDETSRMIKAKFMKLTEAPKSLCWYCNNYCTTCGYMGGQSAGGYPTGQPAGYSTGQPAGGTPSGQPAGYSTGQPAGGTPSGQPAGYSTGQPAGGTPSGQPAGYSTGQPAGGTPSGQPAGYSTGQPAGGAPSGQPAGYSTGQPAGGAPSGQPAGYSTGQPGSLSGVSVSSSVSYSQTYSWWYANSFINCQPSYLNYYCSY